MDRQVSLVLKLCSFLDGDFVLFIYALLGSVWNVSPYYLAAISFQREVFDI